MNEIRNHNLIVNSDYQYFIEIFSVFSVYYGSNLFFAKQFFRALNELLVSLK